MNIEYIAKALESLAPNCKFAIDNETIIWMSPDITQPSMAELEVESQRLLDLELANHYKYDRAREYPPMTDYLDAVVKGDTAQQQAYIDACLAVKAKYPKGVA